jgi:hypothetical protein
VMVERLRGMIKCKNTHEVEDRFEPIVQNTLRPLFLYCPCVYDGSDLGEVPVKGSLICPFIFQGQGLLMVPIRLIKAT